jgi:hypothetical protein
MGGATPFQQVSANCNTPRALLGEMEERNLRLASTLVGEEEKSWS